jgi:cell shape-determining protein MreD
MNAFRTILILAAAFLAVFGEATLPFPRSLLGAQVDLLPAIMVYAALNSNLTTVVMLAICGGLWFDTFSANPLGITILPLFLVGFPIYLRQDLILRNALFAQLVLGATASAIVPLVKLLMLLSGSTGPLLGWGTIWQWLVMTAGGAIATPFIFELMERCNRALGYQPRQESSFRPDCEIQRGRKKFED